MFNLRLVTLVATWLLFAPQLHAQSASTPDPTQIEFFEKRVRPVLAENCYACHGPKKQSAGLRLDNAAAIRKGGEGGPVIEPGNPDGSRLVQAVRYSTDGVQMPPKGKLAEAQIAVLTEWVKRGAVLPEEVLVENKPKSDFNFQERSRHWSYQPIRSHTPPPVKDSRWCTSPIDAFILAKLEAAGLFPAATTDNRTWLRRVSFDLIGLPPTPQEIVDFEKDAAADLPFAMRKVVDRLLDSPHYGERWASHWLDLVRYAETMGYEFDYDVFYAWRYRDYVIRAFNSDLPYDQFVVEHLAGDLLPQPRRNLVDGSNESILATGFLCLGEGRQTPIDVRQEQTDWIDGQIDVLGKAFLGQTLACARCHDHKFDAISTADYYALVGIMKSSRLQQTFLDPHGQIAQSVTKLRDLQAEIIARIKSEVADKWLEQARQTSEYLLACKMVAEGENIADVAQQPGLDAARLQRWVTALAAKEISEPTHPLATWHFASNGKEAALRSEIEKRQRQATLANVEWIEDFRQSNLADWRITGDAFAMGAARTGDVLFGDEKGKPTLRWLNAGVHSQRLATRLQGEMRSRTFPLTKDYVHVRLSGQHTRVKLIVDGYQFTIRPMYDGLIIEAKDDAMAWKTMDVKRWRGHDAYLEILDSSLPQHANPAKKFEGVVAEDPADGYVAVEGILLSDAAEPPPSPVHMISTGTSNENAGDLARLAKTYEEVLVLALQCWRSGDHVNITAVDVALLNWVFANGLIELDTSYASGKMLSEKWSRYRAIETELPRPLRAPAIADGTGQDEFVFVRGNYKTPGPLVTRGLPRILTGSQAPKISAGSGRLEVAQRLVRSDNPLLARVLVNRLWLHHFGEGLVRTPDDFGARGLPPTHPDLLDYLASEFIRDGWSMKAMHRRMVLSSVYRMSSRPDPRGNELDPTNQLLHRANVRRLEGEVIRDTLLTVSGRLDSTPYGPSVLPYLTNYMEGRGRPSSGPLDGDGRRSIYISARRNFLTPLLLVFDYPATFSTVGRRDESTNPAQALTLLNDPIVCDQVKTWARRLLADPQRSFDERIADAYLQAYGRPVTSNEIAVARDYVEAGLKNGGELEVAWAELLKVLVNVKEFIYVQ